MSLPSQPDPTTPADSSYISSGASYIRALTAWIIDFLSVSFNMSTGQLNASAVPNGLPTPYGSAGTILQSNGASSTPSWADVGTVVPAGLIAYFGGALPTGWLECDGSVKNIASYTALAAILGTTYGGDGVTTFGLPDLRGRVAVGLGTGTATDATTWTLGEDVGEETHTLTTNEMPGHTHSISANTGGASANGNAGPGGILSDHNATATGSAGGGGAHNNLQPSLGLRAVIKT